MPTTSPAASLKQILILSSPVCPFLLNGLIPSHFPIKNLNSFPISLKLVTSPGYFIFLYFITLIIPGEENNLQSSSLCNFIIPYVASSLLRSKTLRVKLQRQSMNTKYIGERWLPLTYKFTYKLEN
jgi:hypothetical protein